MTRWRVGRGIALIDQTLSSRSPSVKLHYLWKCSNPKALKKELAKGKGDGEILKWIEKNARHKRSAPEVAAWSVWQEQRAPDNPESRGFFNEFHGKIAPKRTDIVTWFDLLDLDDYVSFGGKG